MHAVYINHWLTCACRFPRDVLCMKYIKILNLNAKQPEVFGVFFCCTQLGQGNASSKHMLLLSWAWNLKAGNFPSVKGNRNSLDGQCGGGGGGLIMESKISWDKSTCLSNRESPLPSVFLCLMQRLTCDWKSEVSCHRLIKSQVESRWPPKISLSGEMV